MDAQRAYYGIIEDGIPDNEPVKTLRDEIAINVMHSMLDKNAALFKDEHYLANRSYRIADAMLAARTKES
jgi:hypothetical protein